jgi:hypothetical protein
MPDEGLLGSSAGADSDRPPSTSKAGDAPQGAEGYCPACYHPFDSCRHCAVIGELSPEDASSIVENIAERLLEPAQRIVAEVRLQRDKLRAALVGLVGVDGSEELGHMEAVMRLMAAPAEDKAATIDAIHALVATLEAK